MSTDQESSSTEASGPAPRSAAPSGRVPFSKVDPRQLTSTLFERVGGRAGVERIVDAFYDRVEQDAELRPLFGADTQSGRAKQKLFFEQWLGGEPRYSERYGHPRLRMRHFPFVIDERAVGRWLRHMGEALLACEVAREDVTIIMERLGPLARHMMNVGEDVPRQPLGDVRLP